MTALALLLDFAAVLALALLFANAGRLFGPKPKHVGDAELPYETGLPPLSPAGEKMSVLYYRFAVLFVVFDVDLVFLLPWAASGRAAPTQELVAVTCFVGVLGLMLAYFWRKGVLECR
ncbi:MAG: NADH-quinone oxidoreductase subunit A [Thermoanaerobaculia bacterium]